MEYRWVKRFVWLLDRFHSITLLEEKPPNGYMWSGWRNTRKQLTSRPRHLWPELLDKIAENAKLKEKEKWSHEKLHLDNAWKLRGIYFIDPEDEEFKKTIKNTRKKLETPVAPAMPCKTMKSNKNCGSGASNKVKTKLACILGASESTRLRMGESLPTHHEDHIAGRGNNSLQHYNLVHCHFTNWFLCPEPWKIPAAKAAVDKEWEKLEKNSAWNLTKVRSKKEVIDEARKKERKVHFSSLMDICHLKNSELEPQYQKYKCRVVLRGDLVEDDSGSYAVFNEQGSSASQMTAAKVMDIISRLPGYAGQAADAVSAYTEGKMEDTPKLLKIPKSECPDIWIRLPWHKWPKSWSSIEDQLFLLNGICTVILCQDYYGKGNLRKSYSSTVGRRFPIGNAYSYTVKKGYSYLCMWMTLNWLERNKTLIRCGNYSTKKSIWENKHLSLIMYSWAALKDHVK